MPNKSVTRKKSAKKTKTPSAKTAAVAKQDVRPHGWQKFIRPADVQVSAIPSSWQITRSAATILWEHKNIMGGLMIVYGLLSLLLVRGFGTAKLDTDIHSLSGGLSSLSTIISSNNSAASGAGGVYQLLVIVIISLATIWGLRAILAHENFRLRDTFYKGMYPFIPFVLILLLISAELLPFVLSALVYSIVVSYDIALTFLQRLPWLILLILGTWLTLYMVSSSIFALYISTLPDMTPMRALRSARELVRYRRLSLVRKLLFLPLLLVIITAVIMAPVIVVLPVIAEWVFFALSIAGLVVVHVYLYVLYRDLLA